MNENVLVIPPYHLGRTVADRRPVAGGDLAVAVLILVLHHARFHGNTRMLGDVRNTLLEYELARGGTTLKSELW